MVSTPFGYNDFYSYFEKGAKGVKNYQSFRFTFKSNKFADKNFIYQMKQDMPKTLFDQEFLGKVINSDSIFGLNVNELCRDELSNEPTVCYAIDLGSINDATVITGIDIKGNLTYFKRFLNLTYPKIHEFIKENIPNNIILRIDNTGVGVAFTQECYTYRQMIDPFNFTQETKERMVYGLMHSVENKTCTYNEFIKSEMLSFQMKRNHTTGRYKFDAKPGFFDDALCSFMMALDKVKQMQPNLALNRLHKPKNRK